MSDDVVRMAKRVVKANGHTRTLLIPIVGTDEVYNKELVETEIAKETEKLNKKPHKHLVSSTDSNAVGLLKERIEWRKHKEATGARLFGGITLGSR